MNIFKNRYFSLSTVLAVTALSLSQHVEAGLINTVVRGGGNIFIPSYEGQNGSAGKGIVGGLGVEVGVGPASVIADVLYAKRVVEYPSIYTETLTYIHVPVQAQLSLGLFHFSGGLYFAKGLGKVSRKIGSAAATEVTYAEAGLDGSDFGAVAGFGVGIPLGITSISADVRYNLGMKDVLTNALSKKNRSIDLLVSLTF
jgi:hypothetical protein